VISCSITACFPPHNLEVVIGDPPWCASGGFGFGFGKHAEDNYDYKQYNNQSFHDLSFPGRSSPSIRCLVAFSRVQDLSICAKHLSVAATKRTPVLFRKFQSNSAVS
jgi:hypothetical protein